MERGRMNEKSRKNDRVEKSNVVIAVLEYFLSPENCDNTGKEKSLRLFYKENEGRFKENFSRPILFRMWKEHGVHAFYITVDKSKPIAEYKDKVVELLYHMLII
eukprot:910805-Ditylum_brightwellii.AAC.1